MPLLRLCQGAMWEGGWNCTRYQNMGRTRARLHSAPNKGRGIWGAWEVPLPKPGGECRRSHAHRHRCTTLSIHRLNKRARGNAALLPSVVIRLICQFVVHFRGQPELWFHLCSRGDACGTMSHVMLVKPKQAPLQMCGDSLFFSTMSGDFQTRTVFCSCP